VCDGVVVSVPLCRPDDIRQLNDTAASNISSPVPFQARPSKSAFAVKRGHCHRRWRVRIRDASSGLCTSGR
jgi:hypothetical protein